MDLGTLKTEITTDPLVRGYAGMSDAQVADSLNNTIDRTKTRTSVSPGAMQAAVVGSEFVVLSDVKQRAWLAILSDDVDPNNANIVTQITQIWSGTSTLSNLAALKTEAGSRAGELNLGVITPSDVAKAKVL